MPTQPTVVLVHGAFADASGFAGVIRRLQAEGVPVSAPMNPLRGLASDAEAITRYASTIEGPVVLVAHSYAGRFSCRLHGQARGRLRVDSQSRGIHLERSTTCR